MVAPEKLAVAYRYANTLPAKPNRDYANAFIGWMHGGAVGFEPERGRLSRSAAQAVRQSIAEFKLWEG